jgi:nicotinamidase/pyrazinamidase
LIEDDPDTGLNTDLLSLIAKYDGILIAGQALSHCVAATVRQVLNFEWRARYLNSCLMGLELK